MAGGGDWMRDQIEIAARAPSQANRTTTTRALEIAARANITLHETEEFDPNEIGVEATKIMMSQINKKGE